MQHGFGPPSQPKVCTGNTRRPSRPASSAQDQLSGRSWLRASHGSPVPSASPSAAAATSRSWPRCARRQPPCAAIAAARAASIAGRQRGSRRAGSRHLALDHAFGFELADVGPAAIKVLCQCRRANGRGLGGSPSRDRLGDGRAIKTDGFSHRVRSYCVAVG
jgi:hypothetical protein